MERVLIASIFELGKLYATPEALRTLKAEGVHELTLIGRHALGDWGDVCAEDKARNDWALKDGGRILSAYVLPVSGEKIWVITESSRSYTTLLLSSEY